MNPVLFTGAICALSLALAAPTSAQSLSTQDNGQPNLILASGGTSAPQVAGSLTTLFASNNGFAGNMFDITPTADLSITSIDINVTLPGTIATVDVWYMTGSSIGNETNAALWTLMGTYSGTSAGQDLPTPVDMTGNGVTFVGGTTYGIYIDLVSYPTQTFKYTNGPFGGSVFANADLSLLTNAGRGTGGFASSVFQVRDWNGTIHYDTGASGPSLAVTGLVGGGTATISVAGATAGGSVLIGYSLTGAGPTMTPFGLVDMSMPITQLPTLTANAAGDASMTTGVPTQASGFTVYMQAADLTSSALTNSLAQVVL